MTDVFTGWTSTKAMWGKTAKSTFNAMGEIEQDLPFPIIGFNVDNGNEFCPVGHDKPGGQISTPCIHHKTAPIFQGRHKQIDLGYQVCPDIYNHA